MLILLWPILHFLQGAWHQMKLSLIHYIYINVHEQTFCYIIIITEVFVGEYAGEFQPKIQKSSMCILY